MCKENPYIRIVSVYFNYLYIFCVDCTSTVVLVDTAATIPLLPQDHQLPHVVRGENSVDQCVQRIQSKPSETEGTIPAPLAIEELHRQVESTLPSTSSYQTAAGLSTRASHTSYNKKRSRHEYTTLQSPHESDTVLIHKCWMQWISTFWIPPLDLLRVQIQVRRNLKTSIYLVMVLGK